MDICFDLFQRSDFFLRAALDDVDAIRAHDRDITTEHGCCMFASLCGLHAAAVGAAVTSFVFLAKSGVSARPGPVPVSISSGSGLTLLDIATRCWKAEDFTDNLSKSDALALKRRLAKDLTAERLRLGRMIERGYIVIPPDWSIQRLLWIGRISEHCPFARLPREIVLLIIHQCPERVPIFYP